MNKLAPASNLDPIQEKIASIMNPTKMSLSKDHVRVLIEIIPKNDAAGGPTLALDSMAHYSYVQELFDNQRA